MRALVQRVTAASVSIDSAIHSSIGPGLLILLGIADTDTPLDIAWLAPKLAKLRVFADAAGSMNLSLLDTGGSALVVSQFTLLASTQKGNRPSFLRAARPEQAILLYETFRDALAHELARPVQTGRFGADMKITLTNDGPVTVWLDSAQRE